MKNAIKALALATTGSLLAAAAPASASTTAKQYPHEGDLYYDGGRYADSFFSSHANYGNYVTNTFWSDPGLEIDINTGTVFFSSCTSWSDMPKFYDDCVTAGYSETGGGRSFGIGTYDLRLLQKGRGYTGEWYFSGGSGTSTSMSVSWQEVWKDFCPVEDPWCMNSNAGGRFFSGNFTRGSSFYQSWYY